MTTTRETINHPAHYNPGHIECIDVIDDWGLNFELGSAVKYICRCDRKDNAVEDLKKAVWYIQREIMRRGGADDLQDRIQSNEPRRR